MNSGRRYCEVAKAPEAGERPSFFRGGVLDALAGMKRGRLRLDLPDGTSALFGAGPEALPLGLAATARVTVRREAFFRKCVLAGDIGFAESYIDGDWSSPDPVAVIRLAVRNLDRMANASPTLSRLARSLDRLRRFLETQKKLAQTKK